MQNETARRSASDLEPISMIFSPNIHPPGGICFSGTRSGFVGMMLDGVCRQGPNQRRHETMLTLFRSPDGRVLCRSNVAARPAPRATNLSTAAEPALRDARWRRSRL